MPFLLLKNKTDIENNDRYAKYFNKAMHSKLPTPGLEMNYTLIIWVFILKSPSTGHPVSSPPLNLINTETTDLQVQTTSNEMSTVTTSDYNNVTNNVTNNDTTENTTADLGEETTELLQPTTKSNVEIIVKKIIYIYYYCKQLSTTPITRTLDADVSGEQNNTTTDDISEVRKTTDNLENLTTGNNTGIVFIIIIIIM